MGIEVAIGATLLGAKWWEITEHRKAADAAERASEEQLGFQQRKYQAEKQMADVTNIRNMRQSIRQARIQAASATNSAANAGGMGSSGLAGVTSSVGAQSAGNLNYMQTQAQTNASIGSDAIATGFRVGDINAYGRQSQLNATTAGMVGGIAGTVFGAVGGPAALAKGVDSIFASKPAAGKSFTPQEAELFGW